jgi:hypothetical protein
MRGLASFPRSTAPSNGMDAQRSAGVLLSSPAAAQRCAEAAGLDSGAAAVAQSAMPSIALSCSAPTEDDFPPTPTASVAPQLQPRISTSLTDVSPINEPPRCHLCGRYISPWCEYPDCPHRAEKRTAEPNNPG